MKRASSGHEKAAMMRQATRPRLAIAAMLTAIAFAAVGAAHADVKKPGPPLKHGALHGPGSSHNPIVYHPPLHGSGSTHNPIVRHPPLHGAGSTHNPIVVAPDCDDPNTLCRRP